jgi:thiol:disulfide interchange protein DsbC
LPHRVHGDAKLISAIDADTFPVFFYFGHQGSEFPDPSSGATATTVAQHEFVKHRFKPGAFMMLPRAVFALIAGMFFSSSVLADATLDRVRAGIARNTDGKVTVTSVSPTPIPGLFEVVSGTDVFYSDASGRFVLVDGRLVDTEQRQDLTQATLQKILNIDFKKLPFDLAFKTVIGSGKRQLAVFEDPACPACRELHGSLAKLTDVTIYHFPLPIISEASAPAAASALCMPANRRAAKWHAYMSGAEAIPAKVEQACEPALAKVGQLIALGNQHQIQNTPTIVLGNGQRMVGRVPIDVLSTVLDAAMVQ